MRRPVNEELLQELTYENEIEAERREIANRKLVKNPRAQHKIPVQREYQLKIDKKIEEIHDILTPTVSRISKIEVIDDIRDRLYIGIKPSILRFNECNRRAMDLHDNYRCSEQLLNDLETQGIPLAKSLAKEF